MLYGFGINGFRNFSGAEEWVGPLSRVNIFIGTNNSGKSNILRFVRRIVGPAVRPGRHEVIDLTGVDVPRSGERPRQLNLKFPFDPQSLFEANTTWQPQWTATLARAGVIDDQGLIALPITLQAAQQGNYYAGGVPNFEGPDVRNISHAWSTVTGTSGGSINNWYPGLLNKIIQRILFDIKPHFIPSFRQLPTKSDAYEDEYVKHPGGSHLIDELAALANPPYDQQDKKLQFEKLRSFIGDIINDPRVEIEIPADRSTINVKSGVAFLPIEALGSGIHEVFVLAAELVLRDDFTILLEEPEVHLHPHIQRRLMKFIMEETKAQYFITTHSASVIDTEGASVFGVSAKDRATVRPLLTSQDRFLACKELGFRASDLLQSNCVVWVEGPSDRTYLLNWISKAAPDLVEGIHYSLMYYGGKLLSCISAVDDMQLEEFVSILPLCRHAALVADSDRGSGSAQIRATKLRVQSELENVGGYFWLTEGREIENYYSQIARLEAVKEAHPKAVRLNGGPTKFAKPLDYVDEGGVLHDKGFDKMRIASYLVSSEHSPSDEALSRTDTLIAFIRKANS